MNGLIRVLALPWAKFPVLDVVLAYVVARSIDWKFNAANALISPGGYNLVEAKASHLSVAVAAAVLPFLLPARWRHAAWWAILGLFSALALVDLLYVRYFDTVPPVKALLYGCQAVGVQHSLQALLQPGDGWFVADWLGLGLVLPFLRRRPAASGRWQPAVAALVLVACVGRFGWLLHDFDRAYPRLLATTWSPRYIAASVGLFSYHAVDVWNTAAALAAGPLPQSEVAAIATRLDEPEPPSPARDLARGANLIVIQVEALQQFTLNRRVEGRPLTPALDAFARRCAYFPNVYGQTGDGNTADAEFMANTSLYPLDHGAAFVCYPGNRYEALPKRLQPLGYRSVVLHANAPTFWNRYLMYPALGFAEFRSADAFVQDERVGLGLSDRSFFRQSLPVLEHLPRPFHATLVTLSSHHPYDDAAHFASFPVGHDEGTLLGHYMQSIHYADEQLGTFLAALDHDGLLDSSVVVLYGDHPGIARPDFPALARLTGVSAQSKLAWLKLQKVPVLVHLPHDRLHGVYRAPGGQIDLLPTMLSLLGQPSLGTFGRDLFGRAPARVALRDGSAIHDGAYFDADEGRAYDLDSEQPLPVPAEDELRWASTALADSNAIVHHDLMGKLDQCWQARRTLVTARR